jgi:UPF0176 protein
MKDYLILLYYCYTKIDDPDAFRLQHHLYCIEHNIKGRIIVASEGLNGTVSGRRADCEQYMADLQADARFAHTEFKIEPHDGHAFQKLAVRVKDEIVHSGLKHINPTKITGTYVEPEEFLQLKDRDDVVLVDVRSDYEHKVGRFKNAVTFDIENFRDFPEKVKELEPYRGKKIITYCTGGIKCEKASAYLLEQGFENVYQLHGGIIKYGLETGGEDFEGKCYVFDNRVVADVNKVNPSVVAECFICSEKCDRMINCANPVCNNHIPMCEACGEKMDGACTEECRTHPAKRPYDGTGFYQKELNGYDPYRGIMRPRYDEAKISLPRA